MQPHGKKLLCERTEGSESVESDGEKVPACSFAVGPAINDLMVFASIRSRRGLLCSTGDRIAGVGIGVGNAQRQGVLSGIRGYW